MYIKGDRYYDKLLKEEVMIEAILPSQLLVSYIEIGIDIEKHEYTNKKRYQLYDYVGNTLAHLVPHDKAA
mgnify:CR=1 FL=1